MRAPLQTFTELKPDHAGAWARLSSVYFNLDEEKGAFESPRARPWTSNPTTPWPGES
ncbi:MAG: hypothetical protein LBT40_08800 [Deltaproteobacteria bacterium]|nr:hypothetical protein [Deltaproteobacteria bacterium]